MRAEFREFPSANVEGAPTLVYEIWSWVDRGKRWQVLRPEEQYWHFHGYHVLSLTAVHKYLSFGYHVERSRSAERDVAWNGYDHGYTAPLFPLLGSTRKDPR